MLEFTAIAIAVLSGVAIIGEKLGHRLGAKWAMREIVRVFQREIVSNDDELKSVAEHLHRSRDVTKAAQTLLRAAMREGEMIQASVSTPTSKETCLVMRTKDLQDVIWLADTGLQTWTADEGSIQDWRQTAIRASRTSCLSVRHVRATRSPEPSPRNGIGQAEEVQ